MLAILDAYRTGLLAPKHWIPNLISGLIVGVVALPLAMAFAIASGVKPEQGLYTAIVAGIIVGIFGGSRIQIAGPTGAFVIILADITARYGVDGLQIATLLAGVILLLMGWLKLGSIIKFIPSPVIVGFTAGIGVIIFIGEWRDFFGLPVQTALNAPFYIKLSDLITAFPSFNWPTTMLACLSLALIWVTPKIAKRVPGPLVAMIVVTALQTIFQFKITTIGNAFGGITQTLPRFHIPDVNLSTTLNLTGAAFTIALLGAIESLLSATAADNMAGTRHQPNQELIGQGLANIVAPLLGGFAATGAIARTATNVRNGGNSPLAAIVHSIFLIMVIVLLAPFATYIPLCALAAVLFVVAYNMSDVPHFLHMLTHAPQHDKVVLIVTFLLTISTDLVVAVNIGVILAVLFFVRHMIQLFTVEQQNNEALKNELVNVILPEHTLIYTLQGPFFFGTVQKLEKALDNHRIHLQAIIFRLKHVPFMDVTGLQAFNKMTNQLYQKGIHVYLCEINPSISMHLTKAGTVYPIDQYHVFSTLSEAIDRINQ